MARYSGVGSEVGLGSSLPEKWMVERWTRPIYSGNMLVSRSEVLFCFFVAFSSSHELPPNLGTGDEPGLLPLNSRTGFFPPERGRIETDLGSGTGRRSSGRSGEDFFSFWGWMDPLGFFIRAMDFCSKKARIFHGPDVFFLAVHGDFCKGKRPLQQRKWMESL